MKRLAASLILLFIASWSYAQNDLTIYRKNGKKVEMKNATTETRGSNVYITDGNNKTKVFFQSSLDSITGLPEGVLNFNAVDVTLYTKRGDKYVIKNATIKTKDGEVYVREANGTIIIYSMSLLDSVSGRTYDDIVYNYLDTTLFADKVEIDLITKDSKIFMYDNNKVKIFGNN